MNTYPNLTAYRLTFRAGRSTLTWTFYAADVAAAWDYASRKLAEAEAFTGRAHRAVSLEVV